MPDESSRRFFRSRLDQMIDLRHPSQFSPSRMPCQEIEASLAHQFARQVKAGNQIEDIGLFGPGSATSIFELSGEG